MAKQEDEIIIYTGHEFDRWIANRLIPKALAERQKERIRQNQILYGQALILREAGYSQHDIMAFFREMSPKTTIEELKQEIEDIQFMLDKKEALLSFSKKGNKFRQSRTLIDNELGIRESDILTSRIQLSAAGHRLIFTLNLLLSRHSEKYDQNSPSFYMGNGTPTQICLDSQNFESASLVISPHELYSTYFGKTNYGTNDINFVLKTLHEISKIKYDAIINRESGDGKTTKIRLTLELFQLNILNKNLTTVESQEIDVSDHLIAGRNCLFQFYFSPIFTQNIKKFYVDFPDDLHLRISRATGKRPSEAAYLLGSLLLREKQAKRHEFERDEKTLVAVLDLSKEWEAGRKKRVKEAILKCLQLFYELGLLSSYEALLGAKGQPKYRMRINPNFK